MSLQLKEDLILNSGQSKLSNKTFESNLKEKKITYRYLSCNDGNDEIFSSDMLLLLKSKVSRL